MQIYGCIHRFLTVVIILLATAASVSAQLLWAPSKPEEEHIEVFRLTVSPAPEPKPALKYHFLVPPVDQISGNAATFYYKAMSFEGTDEIQSLDKLVSDDEKYRLLYEAPLQELPLQEAERATRWLQDGSGYRLWLTKASLCDSCNWEDLIREQGMYTLLPQIQNTRGLARAIALRARVLMAQNKPEETVETLRLAFALSRNLGKGTTLIHCLIGIAIQGIMNDQTRTLISLEHSPNLYWALTDLAAHPVDLREGMSYESRFWEFTIHELPELNRRALTAEEALAIAMKLYEASRGFAINRPDQTEPAVKQAEFFGTAVYEYPKARKYLLDHGYTAEQIDAMPVLQTTLLARWKQFELIRDNTFKWLLLPDDESRPNLTRMADDLRAAEARGDGGIFTQALPAIQATIYARIRHQRETELLRVVEALRMYAAEHGGWPEKLDDVTAVPVPLDPWSHKPFEFFVKDGVATLQAPIQPKAPWPISSDQRYELTLRTENQPAGSPKEEK
jgi:hypothetical protein